MTKNSIIFLIIAIIIITGLSTGIIRYKELMFNDKETNSTRSKNEKYEQREHPYGNPAKKGPMPWEFSESLQDIQKKYGTYTRLAAFKAELPDPLPGEHYNIAHAADLLRGTVVKPGQIFSMNNNIGPYTRGKGFKPGPTYKGDRLVETIGGGVCKIASLLYNVSILADLDIVERWSHSMQVPYVPPGQDATVVFGAKDFKFKNNRENPILIWADTEEDTLYMAAYGSGLSPEVKWYHQILKRTKYRTIFHGSKDLQPGEERTIIPGSDGLKVKSWIEIKYPDKDPERKNLGIDYYKPMNRVVERGEE